MTEHMKLFKKESDYILNSFSTTKILRGNATEREIQVNKNNNNRIIYQRQLMFKIGKSSSVQKNFRFRPPEWKSLEANGGK